VNRTLETGIRVVLGGLLVAAVVGAALFVVLPINTREPYTAFYVVNEQGRPTGYLANASVGHPATVVVGVENHEHGRSAYTMVVSDANGTITTSTFTVASGATHRANVTLSFDSPGRKRIAFALYRGRKASGGKPYRSLRVVGNVTT